MITQYNIDLWIQNLISQFVTILDYSIEMGYVNWSSIVHEGYWVGTWIIPGTCGLVCEDNSCSCCLKPYSLLHGCSSVNSGVLVSHNALITSHKFLCAYYSCFKDLSMCRLTQDCRTRVWLHVQRFFNSVIDVACSFSDHRIFNLICLVSISDAKMSSTCTSVAQNY